MIVYGFLNNEVKVPLALRAEQGGEAVDVLKAEFSIRELDVELKRLGGVREPCHWALGIAALTAPV